MALLPILSAKEIIKVLEKMGYKIVRQRDSHIRLYHSQRKPVTVPN
ncbi:MAG: addiction module toxin, HicA family [Ignavibacteria bacterium]|nr:addiction module toxin, HicA family [Ignavibacteria bacterium]